ncbi:MAG TPA: methyltransferase domain-containing protein [Symbiobacteriaceae bacterium]|nr:methyltransferase domain-containing protein [Symbiobacteriaceae bacterium]
MSKFDWASHQPAEVLEEARAPRFQVEFRPLLLGYLGMAPGMRVLEVCCGPGTLAPYLAAGIAPGTVVGLDLDESFIERARAKGGAGVSYVVGSAYALPFPDNTFDAVTSYTGIGVLTDPERAIREMIRVCRPGGTVSVMEPVSAAAGSGSLEQAPGAEHFPDQHEYTELKRRLTPPLNLAAEGIGSTAWPVPTLFGLLARLGLEGVRLNAWGYCTAPDDARVTPEARRAKRERDYHREQAWIETLPAGPDTERLAELAKARFAWLLDHRPYDWSAGFSLAMAGQKLRT